MSKLDLELLDILLRVEIGDNDADDHSLIELAGDMLEESLATDFK
jgi:hypothetical protein